MKKIFILWLLFTLIISSGVLMAKKNSRISVFASSGISFPDYPGWFASDRKPAVNLGFGLELKISPRLIIRENFNFYSYYPKEDYFKSIWFGDTEIELSGDGIYQGDHFFSSYDLWIDLKYILKESGRFSYYVAAGGGVCYMRYVSGGYIGIGGSVNYTSIALHALISGGIGIDYKTAWGIKLFLEGNYRLNFFKDSHLKRGTIPLRLGVSKYI
jgi:hypothetical protein